MWAKIKKLFYENTKLVAAVLAAMLVLGCLSISAFDLNGKIRTETAVRGIYEQTVFLRGVFIRQETVLKSSTRYFTVNTADASAVSTGDVLGLSYDSAASRDRAERISALRRYISLAENALKETAISGNENNMESERAALKDLSADIASHNMDSMSGDLLRVQSAILAGGEEITRLQLLDMRSELERLMEGQSGFTQELTSPAGGLFSQTMDGYESFIPASFAVPTVSMIQTAMASHGSSEAKAYGKLVSSEEWYFAALVPESEAQLLREGNTLVLELSGYLAGRKQVTVASVSAPENSQCAVLLVGSGDLADVLPLRFVSCDAIIERVSGLRISNEAVYYNENEDEETSFIFIVSDGKARSVPVTILAQDGNDVLIATGDDLNVGTRVIIGGRVYENKDIR